jgi:cytochrome c-type biogenesis protein CcsB
VTTADLVSYSLVAIYSAMAVYTIAFVLFAFDLAKRSADKTVTVASPAETVASVGARGGTATLERVHVDRDVATTLPTRRFERIAFALTVLGWLLHVAGTVLRGFADGHVPWSNMFEFALVSSGFIIGVFVLAEFWQNLRFLGAYITGFGLLILGVGTVNFYVDVKPLPPALQSYWLIIHVFVATFATAIFAIGAGLSLLQLLQARREAASVGGVERGGFLHTFPSAERLENLAYRSIVVGFVFWTFTLIAGSIWAERAWGNYWTWDTKEVWTFIIWVIFAGYIHARATRGWRGSRSSWLALIGFATVLFNFTIVNLFFKGLHAYSGL